ncbi:GNAT family N-acetyltransferase [Vibrio viridaestus]|uniref:GNAT family N-acetyltransferase n=1 Tax=Vibrio viridaestus TaxID=2487322 RepID=A0A3N9TDT4_9VIBR|nr:GNAT family N-acetyltransferase [Vibrio viridaestus]RQW61863.1 GNAT family N-acetyltransferase [Vibrio viridaestus]
MKVLIRSAELTDNYSIVRLSNEWGYSISEDLSLARMHKLISCTNYKMYVAEDTISQQICGWIILEKRFFFGSGDYIEIMGLVVDENYRRNKIAQQLIKQSELWAADLGLDTIIVLSDIQREESHRFYQSSGFELKKTSNVYHKQVKP